MGNDFGKSGCRNRPKTPTHRRRRRITDSYCLMCYPLLGDRVALLRVGPYAKAARSANPCESELAFFSLYVTYHPNRDRTGSPDFRWPRAMELSFPDERTRLSPAAQSFGIRKGE